MDAGRLVCGPEMVIPNRPVPKNQTPSFRVFRLFPLLWVRGSREGTRRDETIIYFHFSRFLAGRPQISSGTHLKPPQNLAETTHLPRTSPETLLNPSRTSPNRRQTDSKPIPNRPQTGARPLLILGVVTLHDLDLAYLILLNSIDRCDIDIISILWIQYPYNIDSVPILYIQSRHRIGTV